MSTKWCTVIVIAFAGCSSTSPEPTSDVAAPTDVTADVPAEPTDLLVTPDSETDAASPEEVTADDASRPCGGLANSTTAPTAVGAISGVIEDSGLVFRGIPYAAPPVGALRFAAPAPYSYADSEGCLPPGFKADTLGPSCLQVDADGGVVGSEDCLTLNVWTPTLLDASAAPRPVMVFIHGGGHVQGSANQLVAGGALLYDGRRLSDGTGAVVVSFNYRLGPFGYLALPEMDPAVAGNFGLADQIAVLEWVQDHIAAFGGDPARTMVFGESAGAVSTCALVASPAAKGLFQSALMESGACIATPLATATAAGAARVDAGTSCPSGDGRLDCLRELPAATVLTALQGTINIGSSNLGAGAGSYGPVVAAPLLPKTPLEAIRAGEHNPVPMVVGSNADELAELVFTPVPTADALETQLRLSMTGVVPPERQDPVIAMYAADKYPTPRDAFVAFLSDARFSCGARGALAALHTGQTEPIWRYWYSRRSPLPNGTTKLAVHGIELAYVFGSLQNIPFYSPPGVDLALSGTFMTLWGALAAGEPLSAPAAPEWPTWTPQADTSLVLDAPTRVQERVRAAECEVLETAVFGTIFD